MKTKLLFLITILSFSSAFGQGFDKLLYSKKDQATYLIDQKIIANYELMKQLGSDHIAKIEVWKSAKKGIDQYADKYPNLSEYGLIIIESKLKNIPAKSQTEIREFLHADPNTKVYVDGYLLKNDYLIATQSITEIEFISPNEQNLNEEKIINVWTLNKDIRLGPLNIRQMKVKESSNTIQ